MDGYDEDLHKRFEDAGDIEQRPSDLDTEFKG